MSLVKPGTESTIAFFSFIIVLNNVDFPTFCLPTIVTIGNLSLNVLFFPLVLF